MCRRDPAGVLLRLSQPTQILSEVVFTKLFIGVDLGTSAVKLSLVDEKGAIVKEVNRE